MSDLSNALAQLDAATARRAAAPRFAKGSADRVLVALTEARYRVIRTAIQVGDAETLSRVDQRELEQVGTSAALATIRAVRR